jgi:NTP pyrophosphatase (non-canonical NTP hydrolase)
MEQNQSLDQLQELVWGFGNNRPLWREGQTPRQLAVGIVEESVELLSLFRFSDDICIECGQEAADILIGLLNFTKSAGIDLTGEVLTKLAIMEDKYPIENFQGGSFGNNYIETKNNRD